MGASETHVVGPGVDVYGVRCPTCGARPCVPCSSICGGVTRERAAWTAALAAATARADEAEKLAADRLREAQRQLAEREERTRERDEARAALAALTAEAEQRIADATAHEREAMATEEEARAALSAAKQEVESAWYYRREAEAQRDTSRRLHDADRVRLGDVSAALAAAEARADREHERGLTALAPVADALIRSGQLAGYVVIGADDCAAGVLALAAERDRLRDAGQAAAPARIFEADLPDGRLVRAFPGYVVEVWSESDDELYGWAAAKAAADLATELFGDDDTEEFSAEEQAIIMATCAALAQHAPSAGAPPSCAACAEGVCRLHFTDAVDHCKEFDLAPKGHAPDGDCATDGHYLCAYCTRREAPAEPEPAPSFGASEAGSGDETP